ncbi:unnamed protein product [Acanthosepion pharaonis]|uniref:Uncharacterized protein n=1 Tax=Acanthosepion pharaonis TaxID=158019 RepID=A0A812D861_ACAPH|nr:unnamed protein product [Sepia pharaonis]
MVCLFIYSDNPFSLSFSSPLSFFLYFFLNFSHTYSFSLMNFPLLSFCRSIFLYFLISLRIFIYIFFYCYFFFLFFLSFFFVILFILNLYIFLFFSFYSFFLRNFIYSSFLSISVFSHFLFFYLFFFLSLIFSQSSFFSSYFLPLIIFFKSPFLLSFPYFPPTIYHFSLLISSSNLSIPFIISFICYSGPSLSFFFFMVLTDISFFLSTLFRRQQKSNYLKFHFAHIFSPLFKNQPSSFILLLFISTSLALSIAKKGQLR